MFSYICTSLDCVILTFSYISKNFHSFANLIFSLEVILLLSNATEADVLLSISFQLYLSISRLMDQIIFDIHIFFVVITYSIRLESNRLTFFLVK